MSFRRFGGIERSNVSNVVGNRVLTTDTLIVIKASTKRKRNFINKNDTK